MPVSDVYTARVAATVAATTATPVISLFGTASKRLWVVGVRVEVASAGATPAGNQVLFQLGRSTTAGVTGNTPASGVAHDASAPNSIGEFSTAWTTAPALSSVLADWTLPQTSGSSWEEFPPQGYEWGVPAIANGTTGCGVHLFITQANSTSTTYTVDIIWSE